MPTDFMSAYYWAEVLSMVIPSLLLLAYVIHKELQPLPRVDDRVSVGR